jgi:tetratricopeptide (TPR) repeat protein
MVRLYQKRAVYRPELKVLVSVSLLVLAFGACTNKQKDMSVPQPGTLNYTAEPNFKAPARDEKTLSSLIASARGKEKIKLMGELADLKENAPPAAQETLLAEITALARETAGSDSVELAEALARQGKFYYKQKDYLRSASAWEKAKNIYAGQGPAFDCRRAECISGQIGGVCASGHCAANVELYEELLALDRKCLGNANPMTTGATMQLCEVYSKLKKYEQALKLYKELYERSLVSGTKDDQASAQLNMARTYVRMKKYDMAEPLLRSVLAYAETHPFYGRISPLHIAVLKVYLQFYDQQKKYQEALVIAKRILDLNESQMGTRHPQLTSSLMPYAEALEKAGKKQESALVRKRIRDLETSPNTWPPQPTESTSK